MRPVIGRALLVASLLAVAEPAVPEGSEGASSKVSDVVIVVHPANGTRSIRRAELAKLFTRRLRTWADGERAYPVDHRPDSRVRAAFTRRVHGRDVVSIELYWKRMIFSGRGLPPPEVENDSQVIDFVRLRPGAVGYVSPRTPLAGVRRLELVE